LRGCQGHLETAASLDVVYRDVAPVRLDDAAGNPPIAQVWFALVAFFTPRAAGTLGLQIAAAGPSC
jgi:hypothetical protein